MADKKKVATTKVAKTSVDKIASPKKVATPEQFGAIDRGEGTYTEEARDAWAMANSDAVPTGAPKQNGVDNKSKNNQNREV